jgi:hypothetical protein
MPPKRGHPKPRASSRDSLLLGSLHAPEHGDSGSKVTLPPQPAAAQPAAAQQPAVAQHSTVSIGADTVVLVDAENPGTTASDVRANNIVNGTSKRNRGGSRPTQPKPKHPKLKNDGDEYVPFVEMVQYMEGMSWICFRSFVQSARYEMPRRTSFTSLRCPNIQYNPRTLAGPPEPHMLFVGAHATRAPRQCQVRPASSEQSEYCPTLGFQ